MGKLLEFETVVFDTMSVAAGCSFPGETAFLVDRPRDGGELVTEKLEDSILRWLVTSPAARSLLLRTFGFEVQEAFVSCSVVQPVIENPLRKPGDIDLLLCRKTDPSRCVAFQSKRVKVEALDTATDKLSNYTIRKLRGVVEQANAMRRQIAFFQNYVLIIIEADTVARSEHNIPNRRVTADKFQRIYDFPDRDALDPEVGIAFIEVVQPTGACIDKAGIVAVAVDVRAKVIQQTDNLTNRVKELIATTVSL